MSGAPTFSASAQAIIEAMENDPFVDDAHLAGTSQQDQRIRHYAAVAAAALALPTATTGEAVELYRWRVPGEEWSTWFCAPLPDPEGIEIETRSLYAHPALSPTEQTAAWRDAQNERRRQVEVEGWTPAHDDEHDAGQMASAAATYALAATFPGQRARWFTTFWPWHRDWWKPGPARRMLVKAAALLIAEIERIDRAGEAVR